MNSWDVSAMVVPIVILFWIGSGPMDYATVNKHRKRFTLATVLVSAVSAVVAAPTYFWPYNWRCPAEFPEAVPRSLLCSSVALPLVHVPRERTPSAVDEPVQMFILVMMHILVTVVTVAFHLTIETRNIAAAAARREIAYENAKKRCIAKMFNSSVIPRMGAYVYSREAEKPDVVARGKVVGGAGVGVEDGERGA